MKILYAIQNVGGINLNHDLGDAVPVKHTLRGLGRAGHEVRCLRLDGHSVYCIDDIADAKKQTKAPMGISGTTTFRRLEGGVRRVQRSTQLPYFAAFDSLRFYEACMHQFPAYDLCHEHNGLFSIGAALACYRRRMPYVLTFSADPLFELCLAGKALRGLHAQFAAWAARFTYRTAKRIITVSEPAKADLANNWQLPADKIVVMPNGVDVERFTDDLDPNAGRAALKVHQAPIVCFVGWFQEWHGIDLLVEAFVQVLAELPAAKLVLIGDGNARPTIDRKIAHHAIESSVIITGLLDQKEIPALLAAADVAVLPYPKLPKEMWFSPLKLYEYMAAGKAIVGSRSGQIAQVIQHGENGLLVEPGNVSELACAILTLLRNPLERGRLGKNACKQAIEECSWERYITRLEDIYQHVL